MCEIVCEIRVPIAMNRDDIWRRYPVVSGVTQDVLDRLVIRTFVDISAECNLKL